MEERKTVETAKLLPQERLDDLQNGYFLIQNREMFCFGIDSVLLSAFAQVHARETCIDLGTGNGIIPILLCAKSRGKRFWGLELNPESVSLACRNIDWNGLAERVTIVRGNIREAATIFFLFSFDVVVTNPPYLVKGAGRLSKSPEVAMARHEVACTLDDVVREAGALLKESGRLYMVHRPARLGEIFEAFSRNRLEAKRMSLVYPFVDKAPNLVLLEARKGAAPGIVIDAPLVVYKSPGVYTERVLEMYQSHI